MNSAFKPKVLYLVFRFDVDYANEILVSVTETMEKAEEIKKKFEETHKDDENFEYAFISAWEEDRIYEEY